MTEGLVSGHKLFVPQTMDQIKFTANRGVMSRVYHVQEISLLFDLGEGQCLDFYFI